MARKFKIGDRVTLISTDSSITDGNTKFTIGDIGVIIRILKPRVVEVSWDRPGLGDSRWDDEDRLCPNCWAVDSKGLVLCDEKDETYHPLNWKIRYMYERQPFRQKQLGVKS